MNPTEPKCDLLPCPVEIKPCPYINGYSSDNSDVSFVLKNYETYSDFVVFTEGRPDRCFRFTRPALAKGLLDAASAMLSERDRMVTSGQYNDLAGVAHKLRVVLASTQG